MKLSVLAPAKVNLILRVLGRRPNGYHDLFMVMERLSLADEIHLEEIPSGVELVLDKGNADHGMLGEKNLAYQAALKFIDTTAETRGVRIYLKKRIPLAAGLGGGSSDAAAVLKGLNRLWQKSLINEELALIGARLGADVPFFCYDGPAIAEGVGEQITLLSRLPKLHFLLINPGILVSTPWVYNEYDKLPLSLESRVLGLESGEDLTVEGKGVSFRRLFKDFRGIASSLENDLERVTEKAYPEIREIKEFLLNNGAEGALMSGSGSTVFGIFAEAAVRDKVLGEIPRENWKAFVAENM